MKTKRTLADFGELTAAEKKIVAEIDSGRGIVLGDGAVPVKDAGDDRRVNASFIRYLALGGCDDCKTHEKGLQVAGALIFSDGDGDETNGLDLEGCVLDHDLVLPNCLFPDMVLLRGGQGQTFNFGGSVFLNGLQADGLETKGDVFLSDVKATGEVRLLGTKLGGDLACDGAAFSNPSGDALNADRLETKGTFFLRKGASIDGKISLHGAKVGALNDDPICWPSQPESIGLDRFRYGVIIGEDAPTDAAARLEWLGKIDHMRDFSPQPYEQLAQVLREMGHRNDARDVLIEKERLQRADRRKQTASVVHTGILWLRDQLVNLTVRYGHRPLLAFAWLVIFWATGTAVFDSAAQNGAFKPNSSRVWQGEAWTGCAGPDQMNCYLTSIEGKSYPKFNALIYSADTLLPIVDLELQNVWIPDEEKAPWARWYLWFQILAGWALSLLAVAGFSGLIKKSD